MLNINDRLAEIKDCLDKAENLLNQAEKMAVPEQMKAVSEMLNRQWNLEARHQKLKWEILKSLMGICSRMSIPMVEIGKDKFEFIVLGGGYRMTSKLLREENREVNLFYDKPISEEFTPFLLEIFDYIFQGVSKKMDEVTEEVRKDIEKISFWTTPLNEGIASLESKITKAKKAK